MNTKNILKTLTQRFAISGYEWRDDLPLAISALVGTGGERIKDSLVFKFGSGEKRILISAHMDEVGFVVTNVSKNSFQVVPIGSINSSSVIGKRLQFGEYITDEIADCDSFSDLWITTSSKAQTGDIGSFERRFVSKGSTCRSPALDNRVGCTVLILICKQLVQAAIDADISIYCCFSSREEMGTNGIMGVAREIDPDVIIDIDSAYAKPYKKGGSENWNIPALGKGPALQLFGNGYVMQSGYRDVIERVCRKSGIPLQYEIPSGVAGGTQARPLVAGGFEVIQINVPVAGQHTSLGTVNLKDTELTKALVKELLSPSKLLLQ